jgi:hypothetical protein
MRKEIIAILVCILGFTLSAHSQGNKSNSKGEVFLITEAYSVSDGNINNGRKLNEFVDSSTYITILRTNDTAYVIGIDHGNINSTIFLGHATKTQNTIFKATRNDAEFFKWSFIKGNDSKETEALIFKEYITGSFEERKAKYYFINIVFQDMSQFQIYGRLLADPKNKK